MSRLELPVKEHLRDPVDEAALHRIWMQIDGRLPVARRQRRRVAIGALALAGCAALALVVTGRRDAGPLRLGDGRALFAVEAPEGGARLALSDGSNIQLSGGARFEPLESSGTSFLAVVARGTAAFDVRPGGPRRWQIECGLATVEVVGTRFSCERAPGRLRVAVQRGSVIVRGERVAERARRLSAGESLDVFAASPSAELAPTDGEPVDPASDEASLLPALDEEAEADAPAVRAATASWRELARGGRHHEAFAALGEAGLRRETQRLGVADLLALADVARLSGHPRQAVAPLERILSGFAHDPQAPLAAFALGRLELDALDRPRRAVSALERALSLGVPQSLREDVRARLVEAYGRAGNEGAARAAARAYLSEFPTGRARAEMETAAGSN